ncbi:Lpg1974 family pore-forming outer membrane protein [Stratiformator vulcanicus]|uniref:Uncharacterized protein n=1 Tax=Stratiformator vulcanicus TaxID=2527980 RepID=A0A517R7M3_9PLAN|nr:Lpg1974 family pore-forming outer membrane protein [Stratiformator vulcanicus]QDT39888.1 hypothetical protein Pan189_43000 [Stratiformator vulcanicus]
MSQHARLSAARFGRAVVLVVAAFASRPGIAQLQESGGAYAVPLTDAPIAVAQSDYSDLNAFDTPPDVYLTPPSGQSIEPMHMAQATPPAFLPQGMPPAAPMPQAAPPAYAPPMQAMAPTQQMPFGQPMRYGQPMQQMPNMTPMQQMPYGQPIQRTAYMQQMPPAAPASQMQPAPQMQAMPPMQQMQPTAPVAQAAPFQQTSQNPVYMAPETVVGGGQYPGIAPAGGPVYSSPYGEQVFDGSPAFNGGGCGCDTGCGVPEVGCGSCGDACGCGGMSSSLYHGYGGGNGCRKGLAFGFDFVFLKPRFGSNDAFFIERPNSIINQELGHDFETGYRVWLEHIGPDDFGGRFRYFSFDERAQTEFASPAVGETIIVDLDGMQFAPIRGTNGATAIGDFQADSIVATGNLDVSAFDAEMSQRIKFNNWLFNVGGGLRYGRFEQSYQSIYYNGDDIVGGAASSRRFDGIGPTIFAEMRRPIGCSGFSILANVRGSMLYGRHRDDLNSFANGVITAGGTTNNTTFASFRNDDLIPIAESQLGGEWSIWISPKTVFSVQVAWETQVWFGAGNTVSRNDDLGLDGFTVRLGFEF